MNIHEIETELGIPRASVRYYEKEGLLSPQRGENNYRIYTQAEVETLKKIRLLRELSMPVETIRAVQRGRCPSPTPWTGRAPCWRARPPRWRAPGTSAPPCSGTG